MTKAEWREANRARIRRVNAAYRRAHREQYAAYARARRARDPEKERGIQARSRKKNKARNEAKRIERTYGLDWRAVLLMRTAQRDRCAICREPFTRTPCVDHNHESGVVRALLCHPCNRGLGGFRDTVRFLRSAILYLGEHR